MSDSRSALDAHLADWERHVPAARLAALLLGDAWPSGQRALAWIEHDWLAAALTIDEPGVREARLGWWSEELSRWASGHPHHPVLAAVPADADARTALPVAFAACVDLAEQDSIATITELVDALAAVAAPLRGRRADDGLRATAAVLLAAQLRDWDAFASADRGRVPLLSLARAGLARTDATADGGGRERAFAALLSDLGLLLDDSPLASGFDGIRQRVEAGWCRRARREPARALAGELPPWRWPDVFACWRLARAARRHWNADAATRERAA